MKTTKCHICNKKVSYGGTCECGWQYKSTAQHIRTMIMFSIVCGGVGSLIVLATNKFI